MDRRRTKAVFRLLGDLPFGATAPAVIAPLASAPMEFNQTNTSISPQTILALES